MTAAERPGVTGHLGVERYITPRVQSIVRDYAYGADDALAALAAVLPDVLAKHRQDVLREVADLVADLAGLDES